MEPSDQQSRAEQDLRAIRTLMERATVYRAISAPTALIGGSLARVSLLSFGSTCSSSRPWPTPFSSGAKPKEAHGHFFLPG